MTYPLAWTTSLLAWSVLSNPKAYSEANQTAATLNQLEWGASYLLKTIYNDSSSGTNIIYQARRRSDFRRSSACQSGATLQHANTLHRMCASQGANLRCRDRIDTA